MVYMEELKEGGFTKQWRESVLDAACRGVERMWQREVRGEGKFNRPGSSTKIKRRWMSLCGKTEWYNRKRKREDGDSKEDDPARRKSRKTEANVESVLYVPFIEGSQLRKTIHQIEDRTLRGKMTGKITVIERQGSTISQILSSPAPCKSKEGSCKRRGVTYEISCQTYQA